MDPGTEISFTLFLPGALKAQSLNGANGNTGTTIDAAIALINTLAVLHFKNLNRAGADAGFTTGALVLVDFDRHGHAPS